ncbi:antibiotic biosynthesis monooxygenase [Streptomyces minutiscleroticus]|uniref:ABM domain-containing protein n=1 Tax=Streptomyces minutiscleroticus TaxID=68238 RepID=A0A918KD80_9ACTN|nr:antibiotic biosynthesis monooxygenase [Streptomyces minutiscleroticus]GGX57806.1 hypothetical protein GCM10010358_10020 [Streptomyces minutiscleroticus]
MTVRTVEYIRYRIPEEQSAEFLAAYTRAVAHLAAAPQCVEYELTRWEEDFEHFVLRIVWTSAEEYVEGFRTSELFPDFLAEVEPFTGRIEEMRHYTPTTVRGTGGAVPALHERAGGPEALARLVEVFHDRALKDDVLAPVFAGLLPEQAEQIALRLGEAAGGPVADLEQPGGPDHVIARHLGRTLTEPQRRRWVNLLQDAADEAGLPADAEFRAAFLAHVERTTRRVAHFSASDAAGPAGPQRPKET